MSTKKTKKVVKKAVPQKKVVVKKKKKPAAKVVIGKPENYRVDIEIPLKDAHGQTIGYTFVEHTARKGVDIDMATSLAQDLENCGVGGRIVFLDGTPDGEVKKTWGSVARAGEAAAEEKKQWVHPQSAPQNPA